MYDYWFLYAVKALRAVKSRLIDPNNYLRNWHKGDPCTSNWTKVVCSNKTGNDGYLHVAELYVVILQYHSLHLFLLLIVSISLFQFCKKKKKNDIPSGCYSQNVLHSWDYLFLFPFIKYNARPAPKIVISM